MKRARTSRILRALCLLILYVVCLAGGLLVINYMPGEWKRSDLEYYAERRLREYQDRGRVSNWGHGGMAAVIYGANGKFQDFFRMNGDAFSINFVDQTEEAVPEVLAGETKLLSFPFVRNHSKIGYTSFIYVGIPITEDGAVRGAFFWIKEAEDIAEIMMGYACVLTLFFILIALLFWRMMRVQKKARLLQREYVDNITHDLKSPIAAIKALTESLSDNTIKDEDHRVLYYGMILNEANRQEHMIMEALELSKMQTHTKLSREVTDAKQLFTEALEKYRMLCEIMEIELNVSDALFTLPPLYTNPERIRRVLELLMDNAMKYVPPQGKISVSVKPTSGHHVTVCIEDNGSGISAKNLPRIFDRFFKVDRSDKSSNGSGLGLSIAKETIDNLGERIWVSSKEGEGTSFFFTIAVA